MRSKLTTLILACTVLAGAAAAAQAAPIAVAVYTFQSRDDVNAFQKVSAGSCKRHWAGNQALSLTIGASTNNCTFRSSVVADSSDQHADQGMVASATVAGPSKKLQLKSFVGVGVRQSDSASYVLRVIPFKHKWQYLRDPKGPGGPKVEAAGTGKFVKIGSKPNTIAIRAFSYGGANTSVIASVNGHGVVSTTDSGPDQPDGGRTVVTTGAKGSGAATGIRGVFDNVTVLVPNPF